MLHLIVPSYDSNGEVFPEGWSTTTTTTSATTTTTTITTTTTTTATTTTTTTTTTTSSQVHREFPGELEPRNLGRDSLTPGLPYNIPVFSDPAPGKSYSTFYEQMGS